MAGLEHHAPFPRRPRSRPADPCHDTVQPDRTGSGVDRNPRGRVSTEEPELLDQTAELLGGGGTIDLEQLQALHAAAQDGEPVVVHFKLRDLDKRLDRYLTDRIPFCPAPGCSI